MWSGRYFTHVTQAKYQETPAKLSYKSLTPGKGDCHIDDIIFKNNFMISANSLVPEKNNDTNKHGCCWRQMDNAIDNGLVMW